MGVNWLSRRVGFKLCISDEVCASIVINESSLKSKALYLHLVSAGMPLPKSYVFYLGLNL